MAENRRAEKRRCAAVVGVAVDYPILLWAHLLPGEAAAAAARRIWPTLRLGAAATSVALVPMAFSHYGGLAQLGIFAVAGILTAAAATRWLLPALISPLPRQREGTP